jgi:hypothetical protein
MKSLRELGLGFKLLAILTLFSFGLSYESNCHERANASDLWQDLLTIADLIKYLNFN